MIKLKKISLIFGIPLIIGILFIGLLSSKDKGKVIANSNEETNHSRCKLLANYGELIMSNRQGGVSIIEMIELVGGLTIEDEQTKSFIKSLIIAAYEQPQYTTDRMKKRAVEEFRDDLYLECIKQ